MWRSGVQFRWFTWCCSSERRPHEAAGRGTHRSYGYLQWCCWAAHLPFANPMALMNQFFMFVATVSVLSLVPIVGPMVA